LKRKSLFAQAQHNAETSIDQLLNHNGQNGPQDSTQSEIEEYQMQGYQRQQSPGRRSMNGTNQGFGPQRITISPRLRSGSNNNNDAENNRGTVPPHVPLHARGGLAGSNVWPRNNGTGA